MTSFDTAVHAVHRLRDALNATVFGQEPAVDEVLCGLLGGGHVLLEGLPGHGKTLLAKSLAAGLGLELSRIQCTPDLLPADITGSEILSADRSFEFRRGPIFAPFVLVDEINRAPPRTQAAFLEAMQESAVTWLGRRYPLPEPFRLIATQNPIELAGTYPLPEAQLDRFAMKVMIGYPNASTLGRIGDLALTAGDTAPQSDAMEQEVLGLVLPEVEQIVIADTLRDRAVSLMLALQPATTEAAAVTRQHVRYGPSPRALQAWLRSARAGALLRGRRHLALEDLALTAVPVLRHRVLLNFESEVSGTCVDELLDELAKERLA